MKSNDAEVEADAKFSDDDAADAWDEDARWDALLAACHDRCKMPYFYRMLVATGQRLLIEDTPHATNGDSSGLAEALMQVRSELTTWAPGSSTC